MMVFVCLPSLHIIYLVYFLACHLCYNYYFVVYSAEEDAYDVLHEVNGLAGRWSDMCLALGLRSLEDKIKAEHSKNPGDCLRAVVDKWLQKNYNCQRFGSPTWKTLVKAVADEVGGNNIALAENIAKKHLSKCLFSTV